MNSEEHANTAREFLETSARAFESEDILVASEILWGAAAHALMAVGQRSGLPIGSHRDLRMAAKHLTIELNDDSIYIGYKAAERFHVNFYHGFMDDLQIYVGRRDVRDFIMRLIPSGPTGCVQT